MHLQDLPPGWLSAVDYLPDYAAVKSVSNAAPLLEAKQRWAALGRDPKRLTTAYRHFDIDPAPIGSWESALAHWRRMFARFVDRTYLERYAAHVDLVLDCNEYTAASTWTDPADKARVLMSMRAGARIWNTEYRGREVRSADGGLGRIPDTVKFVLMCGPVGNAWPVEVFDLALAEDCPISYHAYTRYQDSVRFEHDFAHDSGLWNVLEQRYGRKPQWLFGECGPYRSAAEGWRAPAVLGDDEDKLVKAMHAWWADCATTAAYREGRILGPGCWFTSGGGEAWKWYELEAPQLIRLARIARGMWKPGVLDMDKARIEAQVLIIEQAAAAIRNLLDDVPAPLFRVKILVEALNVRSGPAVSFADVGDVLKDAIVPVYAVSTATGWYRIDPTVDKWISGGTQYSVRV